VTFVVLPELIVMLLLVPPPLATVAVYWLEPAGTFVNVAWPLAFVFVGPALKEFGPVTVTALLERSAQLFVESLTVTTSVPTGIVRVEFVVPPEVTLRLELVTVAAPTEVLTL
jgi:hypothetical protein